MKPLHIVIDARILRRTAGGIGRYARSLVRELITSDTHNRYTLVVTADDLEDWEIIRDETKPNPEQWQTVITQSVHYSLREQFALPRLLASLKPDLVHFTHFTHPILWSRPFVVTIHDLIMMKFTTVRPIAWPLRSWAFRLTLRHAAESANQIITVSNFSKHDLVQNFHVNPERITVIEEGISHEYQPVALADRPKIHQQLAARFNIRTPYFLFVSELRPNKGIKTLLEAYEYLCERIGNRRAYLVIVGKVFPKFAELAARIEQSPVRQQITHLKFVEDPDLRALYQGAEGFIFPSLYEGFGLPPLEAMASGTPVIASRASSIPEVVGDAGLLVTPQNPIALAEAMHALLSDQDLWRKLRAQGLARATTFSWRTMAEETLRLYETIAGRETPNTSSPKSSKPRP